MAKLYKLLVNDGNGAEAKLINVMQGVGDKGAPVRIVAQKGVRYELQDPTKAKAAAPDQVRVKRVGKNLTLMFDGSQKPDVVVEDFYAMGSAKEGNLPILAGLAENGSAYEYIPQDPALSSVTPALADGNTPVLMALGGGSLGEAFALSALPLMAAAAGGVSGWAIAGGALGAAALAGGGGGGRGAAADTTAPSADSISGNLKQDETNDTGTKADDGITRNKTPVLVVKAETGATVDVVVNGKTYRATESATTKGEYEVKISDALADATYTPSITVTDAAGNKITKNGVAFTVDNSSATNPANGTSTDKNPADQNSGANTDIAITAVSEDTGSSITDFITSDKSVLVSGTVANFYNSGASAGDAVRVQIFDSNDKLVAQTYATPQANGSSTWAMTAPTVDLVDGDYTIKADIVDAAGNVVKSALTQALKISADYLQTVNDDVYAQEGGLNISTKDASGNVLTNDVIAASVGVSVVEVKFGANAATPIVSGASTSTATKISGLYGDLFMSSDGSYEYKVDDAKAQHLSASAKPKEIFTYSVKNASDAVSSATLTVTVNGANDAASFTDKSTTKGILTIGSPESSANGGLITYDPDKDESTFLAPSTDSLKGTYGEFTFEVATGKWQYKLLANATLADNKTGKDNLVVQSFDGTTSQTVTVIVIGVNSAPVVENNLNVSVSSVDGNKNAPIDGQLPVGTTKISSLIANGMTDVNGDALGIAITQVDTKYGNLFYTKNGGGTWTNLTDVSTTKALLLSANDDTRVYYQQTSAGVDGAFTFVAWDQTSPITVTTTDVSTRGGTTAFSNLEQKVSVNDVFYTSASQTNYFGGTGFDTLIVSQQALNLDLSKATSTQPLSGIEKIDLTGTASYTVTLNLASLTQADQGKLFVDGSASQDSVLFTGHGAVPADKTGAYDRYVFDNDYELIVQHGMTVSFST